MAGQRGRRYQWGHLDPPDLSSTRKGLLLKESLLSAKSNLGKKRKKEGRGKMKPPGSLLPGWPWNVFQLCQDHWRPGAVFPGGAEPDTKSLAHPPQLLTGDTRLGGRGCRRPHSSLRKRLGQGHRAPTSPSELRLTGRNKKSFNLCHRG